MTGQRSHADLGLEPVRLPAQSDPRRTDLYVGTRTWLVQYGLHPSPDDYLRHGYVDFCLKAWPTATGGPLHLATQWAVWTWAADDMFDQELRDAPPETVRAFARALLDVLADVGQPSPDHPLAPALADLMRQTRATMPYRWAQRYSRHLRWWIRGANDKLVDYVQPGRVPTFREYLADRPNDGGMLLAAMWCELAEQCVTPDWDTPLVQNLLESFSACGYLANDLMAGPGERFTAVWALRRDGVPPLTARKRVEEQLGAQEKRFWWLHTALRDDGAARIQPRTGPVRDTGKFVRNLDNFRVALSAWTAASSRYALAAPGKAP